MSLHSLILKAHISPISLLKPSFNNGGKDVVEEKETEPAYLAETSYDLLGSIDYVSESTINKFLRQTLPTERHQYCFSFDDLSAWEKELMRETINQNIAPIIAAKIYKIVANYANILTLHVELSKSHYTQHPNTRILILSILYGEWLNRDTITSPKFISLLRKQINGYQNKPIEQKQIFRVLGCHCPTVALKVQIDRLVLEYASHDTARVTVSRSRAVQLCIYILLLSVLPMTPSLVEQLENMGKRILHLLIMMFNKKKNSIMTDSLCTDLIQQVLLLFPPTIAPFLVYGGRKLLQSLLLHQPKLQDMLSKWLIPLSIVSSSVYALVCIPQTVKDLCSKLIAEEDLQTHRMIIQCLLDMLITIKFPSVAPNSTGGNPVRTLGMQIESMWIVIKPIWLVVKKVFDVQDSSVPVLSLCLHAVSAMKALMKTFPTKSFQSVKDRDELVAWCEQIATNLQQTHLLGVAFSTRNGSNNTERQGQQEMIMKVIEVLQEVGTIAKTLQPLIRSKQSIATTPIKATATTAKVATKIVVPAVVVGTKRKLEKPIEIIEVSTKKQRYDQIPACLEEYCDSFLFACDEKHDAFSCDTLIHLEILLAAPYDIPQDIINTVIQRFLLEDPSGKKLATFLCRCRKETSDKHLLSSIFVLSVYGNELLLSNNLTLLERMLSCFLVKLEHFICDKQWGKNHTSCFDSVIWKNIVKVLGYYCPIDALMIQYQHLLNASNQEAEATSHDDHENKTKPEQVHMVCHQTACLYAYLILLSINKHNYQAICKSGLHLKVSTLLLGQLQKISFKSQLKVFYVVATHLFPLCPLVIDRLLAMGGMPILIWFLFERHNWKIQFCDACLCNLLPMCIQNPTLRRLFKCHSFLAFLLHLLDLSSSAKVKEESVTKRREALLRCIEVIFCNESVDKTALEHRINQAPHEQLLQQRLQVILEQEKVTISFDTKDISKYISKSFMNVFWFLLQTYSPITVKNANEEDRNMLWQILRGIDRLMQYHPQLIHPQSMIGSYLQRLQICISNRCSSNKNNTNYSLHNNILVTLQSIQKKLKKTPPVVDLSAIPSSPMKVSTLQTSSSSSSKAIEVIDLVSAQEEEEEEKEEVEEVMEYWSVSAVQKETIEYASLQLVAKILQEGAETERAETEGAETEGAEKEVKKRKRGRPRKTAWLIPESR